MNTKSKSARGEISTGIIRGLVLVYVVLVIYPVFFVMVTSVKSTTELYANLWGWPEVFH